MFFYFKRKVCFFHAYNEFDKNANSNYVSVYGEFIDDTSGVIIYLTGTYQAKPYYAVHYLLNEYKEGILTEDDVGEYSMYLGCNYELAYGYDGIEKFMEE